MTDFQLHRRDMFKSLLAISAAGALAACGKQGGSKESLPPDSPPVRPDGAFDAGAMVLIAALAQTLIPKTETAGAIEAGVPETLQDLATDWGDDGFRTYWRDGLNALNTALVGPDGGRFDEKSREDRTKVLSDYDARVFDGEVDDGFYRDFKATVVQAYYMSEPGATEELAYEPVPGDWIGCVPLSDYPKNWAT